MNTLLQAHARFCASKVLYLWTTRAVPEPISRWIATGDECLRLEAERVAWAIWRDMGPAGAICGADRDTKNAARVAAWSANEDSYVAARQASLTAGSAAEEAERNKPTGEWRTAGRWMWNALHAHLLHTIDGRQRDDE